MIRLPGRIPRSVIADLGEHLQAQGGRSTDEIVLSMHFVTEDISVRGLSAFFQFIDHIYGRLSEGGLRSYAQRNSDHLRISEVRPGSWEVLLFEALTSKQSAVLAVIFLALKYLPSGLESLAHAYNELEQGALTRQKRRKIRADIASDEKLASLSPRRQKQVAKLIDELYELERLVVPQASGIIRSKMVGLEIRMRRSRSDSD